MSETLLDLRGLTVNFATDDGIVRAVDGIDLALGRRDRLCHPQVIPAFDRRPALGLQWQTQASQGHASGADHQITTVHMRTHSQGS